MHFFVKAQFKRLLRNHLLEILGLTAKCLDLIGVGSTARITSEPLLSLLSIARTNSVHGLTQLNIVCVLPA